MPKSAVLPRSSRKPAAAPSDQSSSADEPLQEGEGRDDEASRAVTVAVLRRSGLWLLLLLCGLFVAGLLIG